MFDCLLKRYEADVLDPGLYETVKESFKKKNKEKNSIKSENSESLEGPESSESSEDSDNSKSWKTWKELQPYEKRVFIVGVIGAIFSIIFSIFFWSSRNNVYSNIFLGVAFISFAIGSFIRNNVPKEKQRMLEEGYNYEYDHMKRMIDCLQKPEFNIDVKDERQLDKLIERAKKGRNIHNSAHSIWRNFKDFFKDFFLKAVKDPYIISSGIGSGVILWRKEVIFQFLLEHVDQQKKLSMDNIFPYFVLFIFVMVLLFRGFLREFFPSKKQILDSFISDVEDIKLFPKIVRSIIIRERNEAKEKASRQKIIKALKSKFAENTASKRRKPEGHASLNTQSKREKEGAGTLGDPQAAGHKKPLQSAEQK